MATPWMQFVANYRRRFGNDAWAGGIDGAIPTDDVAMRARLRIEDRPLLYFTKYTFLRRIAEVDSEFRGADFFERVAVPTRPFLRSLASILAVYRCIRFVGDLDPCDLATFRALQCGSPDLVPQSGWMFPIEYAGVDSRWMHLAERSMRSGIETYTIPMSPMERAQYAALRDSWPGLGSVVGQRAIELLDRGRKLEVEGATAGLIVDSEGFRQELMDAIFGDDSARGQPMREVAGASASTTSSAGQWQSVAVQSAFLMRHIGDERIPKQYRFAAIASLLSGQGDVPATIFTGRGRATALRAQMAALVAGATEQDLRGVDQRRRAFKDAVNVLIGCLRDDSPEVRFFAAFVLSTAGATKALPELRRVRRLDRSRAKGWGSVAKEAADAIEVIEHKASRKRASAVTAH